MATVSNSIKAAKPILEFKSSTFSVPVLVVQSSDLKSITEKLLEKIQQAPEFFKFSPILIDIQHLDAENHKFDLPALVKMLRDNKLIPVGLRGGASEYTQVALKLGLPIQPASSAAYDHERSTVTKLGDSQHHPESETHQPVQEAIGHPVAASSIPSTIVTTPVRSGQRIYAPGDLVVLAQVSAGAEIMAEGNIHVYGSLRGRALAGVQGNLESRIFCFDLQAELISIAGIYKINDDLDSKLAHTPLQIYLQNDTLIIKEL